MFETRKRLTEQEFEALFAEALMVVEGSNPGRAVAMFEELLLSAVLDMEADARPEQEDLEGMINLRMYLGRALMLGKRAEDAVPVLRLALWDSRHVSGERSRLTFSCKGNLCRALGKAGEFEEAIGMALELLNERVEEFGETDNGTLNALGHLSQLLFEAGEIETACELMSDLLEIRTELFGPDDPRTESSRFNLTVMSASLDNDPRALKAMIEEYEAGFGSACPQTITLRETLAGVYTRKGRLWKAHVERTRARAQRARLDELK